jgi:hypothetical protein
MIHREHPLEHEPARVRRGYEIAQGAAANLDPRRKVPSWRRELLGMNPLPPTRGRTSSLSMQGQDRLRSRAKPPEDGYCSPLFLKNTYIQFAQALARAQHEAMAVAPGRFYELARADEMTRFLMRGDVSVLSKAEVGDIGEALRHVGIASANVRLNELMPLQKNEKDVPAPLEGALQMTYKLGEAVAAHGYRCRDNEFLPPLKPDYLEPKEEQKDDGCAIL